MGANRLEAAARARRVELRGKIGVIACCRDDSPFAITVRVFGSHFPLLAFDVPGWIGIRPSIGNRMDFYEKSVVDSTADH